MFSLQIVRRLGLTPLITLGALSIGALSRAADPPAPIPTPTPEQARFFETKVRPVLVDSCVKCHGPEKQKGNLRLDSRPSAITGGDLGPAVVPGNPAESLLVTAIGHEEDLKMPPSKKLPANQVADLKRWVEIGAPWPGSAGAPVATASHNSGIRSGPFKITDKDREHWAFRPIARPRVPVAPADVRDWVNNPIDSFVLAGLRAKGLGPNPTATKPELVRRVYFDLTGLPPTPEEVASFVNDRSPTAYDDLVDRLLASPHYGEKWGRHWLDLVRFAETNSYERDGPKPSAWRYRDYVVKSLNADKPYRTFVREQIAGDEVGHGDTDALTATAYYRLGIWDDEPTDRELAHYDALDDIVATTGQVFLGLTIDCARCHDHKIDPIAQKDYYKLLAFFQNVNDFRNGGPTDETAVFDGPDDKTGYENRVKELEQKRDGVRSQLAAIEHEFLAKLAPEAGTAGARRPDLDNLTFKFYRDTWDKLPDFTLIKPEDVGNLLDGLFDLAPKTRDDAIGFVFEGTLIVPEDGLYTFFLDSDDGSRLAIDGKTVVTYDGIHGVGNEKSATSRLTKGRVPVRLEYFQKSHGLGLSVAWSGPGFVRRSLSAAEPSSERGPKPAPRDLARQIRQKGSALLGTERFGTYQRLRRDLVALEKAKPEAAMVLRVSERGAKAPDTFVMLRGNAHVPGDKVEPGYPFILASGSPVIPTPPADAPTSGRRVVLADWLTDPSNPLPARVMANRLWQHHFGRGIVRSASNFGTQGDRPTHPELLDWLAGELVGEGWRLKPLHRLIMTSNAYKMSSRNNATAYAKDPANDSLWRFDMRRLTAEELRDAVLAVSGDLNPKMYGPGVFPEIPREVMAGQSVPGSGWGKSSPSEQVRRSVYVHVKRSLLLPILESHDLAETDRSTPSRFSTTQPTQALAMLNGSFLNARAAALAARLRREAGDDPSRQVRLALRLVTAREPSDVEVARGVELVSAFPDRDAGLKAFCLVALNLNEFVFLD